MVKNLFDLKDFTSSDREWTDTLAEASGVRVERIASFGQPTAEGEWYDQSQTEWVALLRGTATLVYDDGTSVDLAAGDHLTIPPRRRHRVERTSDDCLWLTVFWG